MFHIFKKACEENTSVLRCPQRMCIAAYRLVHVCMVDECSGKLSYGAQSILTQLSAYFKLQCTIGIRAYTRHASQVLMNNLQAALFQFQLQLFFFCRRIGNSLWKRDTNYARLFNVCECEGRGTKARSRERSHVVPIIKNRKNY